MKILITTLIFIFNGSLFAQSNQIIGDYTLITGQEKTRVLKYKLTLNQDGTFLFHSYTKDEQGIPPEVNKYGKGKWKAEKNTVLFFADKENDIDEKHDLDFNGSKARFISKSPRDKTDRIVETSLQFFESKIFWIERLKILKN
jgi:hypothetical protein